jgi:hypothetical protein
MVSSRIFVALIFIALASSFIASTYVLISEFGPDNWFAMAAVYSHGFLFFPTIGLVALIAFYTPATIFVDLYWHHVKSGKLRLIIGFFLMAGLSIYVADLLTAGHIVVNLLQNKAPSALEKNLVPALWDLHPDTLTNDQGSPAGCVSSEELCARQPVLRSLQVLRKVSQSRTGLTAFSRNCASDPLLEAPPSRNLLRYCFPLLRKVDANSCCFAQERFASELSQMYASEPKHSKTGYMHALTLPFKTFFMLVLFIIGVLLVAWRATLDHYYENYMPQVENGVLIGATAMLFWPITNQAFLQSAAVLYGPYSGSIYQDAVGPLFSLVFGLWGLLILFFFFRHQEKTVELWVKVLGGMASVIAAVRYEEIIDYAVRYTGSGTYMITFGLLGLVGLTVYVSSWFWPARKSKDLPQ